IDAAFQATTDGFLACTLKVDDPNRGDVYLLDTTDSQSKLLAATSAHRYARHDVWHEFASFCAPVRKGRTVKVKSNPTWGSISVNAFWVPLGQLAFGTARPRTLNQTFTAETDG